MKGIALLKIALLIGTALFRMPLLGQTTLRMHIPETRPPINPMIYGQMLENVNDQMIYGGVTDLEGNLRPHVTELVKHLGIPVMRWPGGTVVHEYHWKNGIGPRSGRAEVETFAWKGKESYQFGTDEFLKWSHAIGAESYINLNMGNDPASRGTLMEALEWMEYVNGSSETTYGRKRAENGHPEPYQVKFWGIGNENYGSWGKHVQESEAVYADRLYVWASAIKEQYPDLKLLGVGHTYNWSKTVMEKCAGKIDFLTQHYYITSTVKEGAIADAQHSLFAPLKMEAHIKMLGLMLAEVNAKAGRQHNPVRLSVDEWNNRHHVFHKDKKGFDRQDPRAQFDIAIAAGMFNVFIRQSPTVGMANYIFPVNAHGLIRTIGEEEAFKTALYPLFSQYRKWMIGEKIDVSVTGTGLPAGQIIPRIEGDAGEALLSGLLTYIDASAVMGKDGMITVSLVNRNPNAREKVRILLPENYQAKRQWVLESAHINAVNTSREQENIVPLLRELKRKNTKFEVSIASCGVHLIQLEPLKKQ